MKKIFVTGAIPDKGIMLLKKKGFQVTVGPAHRVLPRKELLQKVKGMDALLSLLTHKIDGGVMDAAGKQLRIVANYAVGFDNIDLAAAKKRNIFITNTPDVLSEAVAEHAMALMLAVSRRVVEADAFVRAGKYKGWEPFLFLGNDLFRKTLGIVGLGRIGQAVARRALGGFHMKVVYHSAKREELFEEESDVAYLPFKKLLATADFITIHVPLLPQTRHLFSTREFSAMKKSAYLINTSRGPVVDEKALAKALQTKTIKGAGIDVFEFEPKVTPALLKLPNVVLTPHIASATEETRHKMSEVAAHNIIAALSGKTPPNIARM